jgi:hypothetical protein
VRLIEADVHALPLLRVEFRRVDAVLDARDVFGEVTDIGRTFGRSQPSQHQPAPPVSQDVERDVE